MRAEILCPQRKAQRESEAGEKLGRERRGQESPALGMSWEGAPYGGETQRSVLCVLGWVVLHQPDLPPSAPNLQQKSSVHTMEERKKG